MQNKVKKAFWSLAGTVAPTAIHKISQRRWMYQHANELKAELLKAPTIERRVDIAREHKHLRSNQKRAEIIDLLSSLHSLQPKRLCEIGADMGGTLALFASVATQDAQLLSVDIDYPSSRAEVYQKLAQSSQTVTCIEADSHSPTTLDQVTQWLNGELFDFLFIDGDHSFGGVRSDYEMYAPLVRSGGIIAFHDIVPDFNTRFGTKTPCDVGEVPRFWSELKPTISDWTEFIECAEQDGYGIGVIRVAD